MLLASHADRIANGMRQIGREGYTALDYLRDRVGIGGDGNVGGTVLTQGDVAELKLQEDENAWSQIVNDFMAGKMSSDKMLDVMTTPLVMRLVGGETYPLKISLRVLGKILKEKHGNDISAKALKSLPRALTDPLVIAKNRDKNGNPKEGIVFVVELTDGTGVVQVPIFVDRTHGIDIGNDIATVFKRDSAKHFGYSVLRDDILYINTKKGREFLNDNGKVITNRIRISSSFVKSIPNETDLVKLKKQNPTMYQSAIVDIPEEKKQHAPQAIRPTFLIKVFLLIQQEYVLLLS